MEENNEEKKNNEFKSVSSNYDSTYRAFNTTQKENKKSNTGFGKSVFLPFVCGILGASVVIGTCVGVPGVRNEILAKLLTTSTEEKNDGSVTLEDINTKLMSLGAYSDTAIEVAKKVQPSIVGIEVEFSVNSIFYRNPTTSTASGSGVIISSDGYILTNNHIVSSTSTSSYYEVGKANKVIVKLYNDDKTYDATIVGTDEQTDLAVIKIEKEGLTAAELGNSDSVQVGEFSMAIGNPLGLESSVTAGIVSAVNRKVTDSDGNTYTAIQTDAAINSGNSGGALVNSKGQVIGINTLKIAGTGIEGVGFAIPINSTKDIYEQLIQYNKVKRPYMGIGGIDLDEETAKANDLVVGVYVKTIEDFSAAEKAGIRVGDVITEIEGTKITTMDELNEIKNKKAIGDTISIKVYRNGSTKNITLTLQEQP